MPCPSHDQRPSSTLAAGPISSSTVGARKASPSVCSRRPQRVRYLRRRRPTISRAYLRLNIPCERMNRISASGPPRSGAGAVRISSSTDSSSCAETGSKLPPMIGRPKTGARQGRRAPACAAATSCGRRGASSWRAAAPPARSWRRTRPLNFSGGSSRLGVATRPLGGTAESTLWLAARSWPDRSPN